MKHKNPHFVKEVLSSLLLVAIFAYGLPLLLTYALGTPYPIASVASGSMKPVLNKGDLVLLSGVEKNQLKIGDIVVYQDEADFIVHRIIILKDDYLITQGDANLIEDKPIGYDQIIGRLINFKDAPLKVPYLGMVSIFAGQIKDNYYTHAAK